MATGVLLNSPIVQFFNNQGLPAVNGSVLTQVGGLNATTFQDVGLSSPLPNPIPLNSRGEASVSGGPSVQVFLTPNTVYTLTLFDGPNGTGNQLWVATYVNGVQVTSATPNYSTSLAEVTVGATIVNPQYPPGYADRYGTNAVPGFTDMTAAIQTAVNVVGQPGAYTGMAVLLGATYFITSTIVIPPGVTLMGQVGVGNALPGAGVGSNIYVNSNIHAVQVGSLGNAVSYFPGVRDLCVTFGPSAGISSIGIRVVACTGAIIKNIFIFSNAPAGSCTGVSFEAGTTANAGCFGNNLIGGYSFGCHIGCQFTNQGGTQSTDQTITGFSILGNAGDTTAIGYNFVHAGDGQDTTITGGFIQTYNTAFQFTGQSSITIVGVYLNGATNGSPKQDVIFSGNQAAPGDTNILFVGRQDQSFGLTTNFPNNSIPSSCAWITGSGINGAQLGTGINDASSIGIGGNTGAPPLATMTLAPIRATAVGSGSLAAVTTGADNTACGRNALNSVITGASNTAVGSGALSAATSSNNAALGTSAGNAVTTGSQNTALGASAQAGTTGIDNTAVGNGAIIGTTAGSATANDQFLLGDASVATLYCKQTTITTTSDINDKTDITPLKHGLAFVRDLEPVEWTWKHRAPSRLDGTREQGFVAQHLQLVRDKHGAHSMRLVDESNPDLLGVAPGKVLMPAIVAIQELAAENDDLKARIAALEAKVK